MTPESPHTLPPTECSLCGAEEDLEQEQHGWVCVDYLACIGRGLVTAQRLTRRMRQLSLLDDDCG